MVRQVGHFYSAVYSCQGYKVRFFGCTALVTQLLEAREDRQLQRWLKQFEKQNLLVLDELGYVPFSKTGAELLHGTGGESP